MINQKLVELYNAEVYSLSDKINISDSALDLSMVNRKLELELFEAAIEKFKINLFYKIREHFKQKYMDTPHFNFPIVIVDSKVYLYEKDLNETYLIYSLKNKKEQVSLDVVVEELHENSYEIFKSSISLLDNRVKTSNENMKLLQKILDKKKNSKISTFELEYEVFTEVDKHPLLSVELYKKGSYYCLSLFGYKMSLKDLRLKEPRLLEHREYSEKELEEIIDNAIDEIIEKVSENYPRTLLREVNKKLNEDYGFSPYETSILKVNAEIDSIYTNFKTVELPISLKEKDISTVARFVSIVGQIQKSTKEVRNVFKYLFMSNRNLDLKIEGISLPSNATVGGTIEMIKEIKEKSIALQKAAKYSEFPKGVEEFYYSKSFFMDYKGTFKHNGKVYIRVNYRLPGCMKIKMLAFEKDLNNPSQVRRISNNRFFKQLRKLKHKK